MFSEMKMIRALLSTAALFLALATPMTSTASAGDCQPCVKKRCYYKCVYVWKTRRVPYYKYVTYYDHCGCKRVKKVLCYRTERYRVKKYVKVCY